MVIIGISGKATSGKDTVANYYSRFSKAHCTTLHFADSLKDCCQGLLIPFGTYDMSLQETKKLTIPWMGKNYTVRNLLQDVGNAFRQSITEDFWVNIMIGKIAAINKNGSIDTILIPDVRYPNEFKMIKDSARSGKEKLINLIKIITRKKIKILIFIYPVQKTEQSKLVFFS